MNKLITLLIFVFVFEKIQAQTQWNTVTNLSNPSNTSYGHFLNVIDSATVILTPKYTFDTPDIKKQPMVDLPGFLIPLTLHYIPFCMK